MKYLLLSLFVVLSLTIVTSCGQTPNETNNDAGANTPQSNDTLPVTEYGPFELIYDNVKKVTLYYGSDELVTEIKDLDGLNALVTILQNAQPFSGNATADLNNTIVIESPDGVERELIVTGNGHVFIDQTSKYAYVLDKERFLDFVESFGGNKLDSTVDKNEKANIYEMESFAETKKDSLKVITDSNVINNLKQAFNSANQNAGIVDMADPEYKVELGKEVYFLWVDENSGTIMNVNDTHTIYSLSEKSAKQVNEVIR